LLFGGGEGEGSTELIGIGEPRPMLGAGLDQERASDSMCMLALIGVERRGDGCCLGGCIACEVALTAFCWWRVEEKPLEGAWLNEFCDCEGEGDCGSAKL